MNPNLEAARPIIAAMSKGRFYLKQDTCFCAVGALCEAYRQQTGAGSWHGHAFVLGGKFSAVDAPIEVLAHFGFTREDGYKIMRANDHTPKTLMEIIYEKTNIS